MKYRQYYTTSQVAELYGCTRGYIHTLIHDGRLETLHVGQGRGYYLVPGFAVRDLLRSRRKKSKNPA